MTLLPGKRVDHILPALPPLCLVLTAILVRAQRAAAARAATAPTATKPGSMVVENVDSDWPRRWSRWSTGGALLLTLVASAGTIIRNYRTHADALSTFGEHVRAVTTDRQRRVELVVERPLTETDATMLVYLRRLSFYSPAEAIQQWSLRRLDAVVISATTLAACGGSTGVLDPFAPARPEISATNASPGYSMISSRQSPVTPRIKSPLPAGNRKPRGR